MKKLISAMIIIFLILIPQAVFSASEISISEAVKKFAQDKKRMRIAVFDFSSNEKKTRYDSFIADSIISELSKYQVTLLERKKLTLLLKEHELSQSGVVDSEKAMKLGELLPVDVIVSGSYAELENRLIINGRFIHVGTGEIIYAFTASMDVKSTDTGAADVKSKCENEQQSIKEVLSDLRSESEVKKAVDTAVAIPFDDECGRIHYDVIYTFIRYKKYPEKYQSFLIETLDSIDNPSNDNRANEIINYFASDGRIDSDEWKAGFEALRKMSLFALHNPLQDLLKGSAEERPLIKRRADDIIQATIEGRLGKPVPFSVENVLFSMFSALRVSNFKTDMSVPAYIFKKYSNRIPDNEKSNKKATEVLHSMYLYADDRSVQKEILSLVIAFYKSRKSAELAERCADFIRIVEVEAENPNERDKNVIQAYSGDLKIVNESLEDVYCESIDAVQKKGYHYIVDDRVIYVLKNKMKCRYSPSIKDLEADMQSGDWENKLKAVETLTKIGTAASDAEQTVIKYLGQQGYGSDGGKLRSMCAKVLGNIKTSNPKGITMLIESFPDYDDGVSYEAEEAIKKIGLPALSFLIKGLSHEHHAVRLRCAVAIGNLGKKAEKAVQGLKRLSEKDEDPYVRKQAAGAIQMINNDF